MTVQEVANRYYELISQNKREQIQNELYHQNIVCVEPEHAVAMGIPTITRGIDAVKEKSKKRNEIIQEIHSDFCSEPTVGGKYFSVSMSRDLTLKGRPRMQISEIAVFQIEEGKIISEEFFY